MDTPHAHDNPGRADAASATRPAHRPLVGVTCAVDARDARARRAYARAIRAAGGVPIYLPPPDHADDARDAAAAILGRLDALVLSGGDDPRTEAFGEPTDPRVTPIAPERQAFEEALVRQAHAADVPTLGVCLGMQLMALVAGGRLDQWMAETTPTHAEHFDDRQHPILPEPGGGAVLPAGEVTSWHRQAVTDAGRLRVSARAHDGVIEAVDDPARRYWLGVQWHPERSNDPGLGQALFDRLLNAAAHARVACSDAV